MGKRTQRYFIKNDNEFHHQIFYFIYFRVHNTVNVHYFDSLRIKHQGFYLDHKWTKALHCKITNIYIYWRFSVFYSATAYTNSL